MADPLREQQLPRDFEPLLDAAQLPVPANDEAQQELEIAEQEISQYWADLPDEDEGDGKLGEGVLSRVRKFREWCRDEGLIRGWMLKLHYWHNEYRENPTVPHLSVLQQWGSQGEFHFMSINHLRSLLKTVLSQVVQNPPSFAPRAVNSDADSKEAAALYQGVLDYYKREMKLDQKINKAAEMGMVVDQSFVMVEWDPFASNPDEPGGGIWSGNVSVRVLSPWDVIYDYTKAAWTDLDWVIVRDWVPRQKALHQFPEHAEAIKGSKTRAQIIMGERDLEQNTRYMINSTSTDMSEDIQVFKLFFRDVPWMPGGIFAMFLENGDMVFRSPKGLVYPKIPVERFVPDEQLDVLLGYSPINELLGIQEGVNTILSSILSNAVNYAHQFIVAPSGSELNPKTLETGHRLLEYPAGPNSRPPEGMNLTKIPPELFKHLEDLMRYMQQIASVSNVNRGETPGANTTGALAVFLSSQTSSNQGPMASNYAAFSADVMTMLLHVLRVFARTERTIDIMGKTVASKTIVLSDALKDFDEVVVDLGNPIMNTPQGKAAVARELLQYGEATPAQYVQVLTSGNLNAMLDPTREKEYYLEKENQWLLEGRHVLVDAMDDHEAHIMKHAQLKNLPHLRLPELAEQIGEANAPQILMNVNAHIAEHMQYLSQNTVNSAQGQAPGAPPQQGSSAMGSLMPSPEAPADSNAQAQAVEAGTSMPQQPSMPKMPQ